MKTFETYRSMAEKALLANPTAVQSLKLFAVSDTDFKMRLNAYSNAMGRTAQLEDRVLAGGAHRRVMAFAAANPGMGAANLRGTTIYPATIMSYVSSIAPIFAVERDMDTPSADLQYMDFYNITTGDMVLPNLGQDALFGNNVVIKKDVAATMGTSSGGSYTASGAIIPRSVKIEWFDKSSSTTFEIVDNGNGKLMAEGGVMTTGTVNYNTGVVALKLAAAIDPQDTLKLSFALDTPSDNAVDKMGGQNKYYHVTTEPVIVPIQRNIISDAAMNKQGVIDPNELYTNVIQAEYTKLINEKVASGIVNAYVGDTYTADLSGFALAAGNYDSFIRTFQSLLVDGESTLGKQTYKGSKVTGILAGAQVSNVFQYMTENEGWIPNTQLGYFKDLIGWYKGIPVVRWTSEDSDIAKVADDEIYLTHKTADGQLAPTVRGMFLSPTDLPEIANFSNPTQLASGMFSLEGVRPTTSKLAVKLKITLPASQVLHKQ